MQLAIRLTALAAFLLCSVAVLAAPPKTAAPVIREPRSTQKLLAELWQQQGKKMHERLTIHTGKTSFTGRLVSLSAAVVALEEDPQVRKVESQAKVLYLHYIPISAITAITIKVVLPEAK